MRGWVTPLPSITGEQSGRRARLERFQRFLDGSSGLELSATMTLVLLLIYGGGGWYVRIPITLLAVAALLFPVLRTDYRLWFAAGLLMTASNFRTWYTTDNHKYLIAYWCLAFYAALRPAAIAAETPPADPGFASTSLARSARYLIGLSFLSATLWKLRSPDFLDGTFFHFSLLLDERFRNLSIWFGGATSDQLRGNIGALGALVHPAGGLDAVFLSSTSSLGRLSIWLTRWTVAIEGLVAVAFLSPGSSFPYRVRHGLLLVFILTTYAVAPVTAFGWILLVMGFSQVGPRGTLVRLSYVCLFFVLQIYRAPWSRLVDYLIGVGAT